MTHQFLLHLHRRSRLIEPRAIGMAEGVPTDSLRETDEFGDPAKLTLLQALLVVRLAGLRIGENPILILGEGAEAPPPQQQFFETKVQRHIVLRILRLHLIDPSTDRAALNQKGVILEIEITPLQAQDFADAKSVHCATITIVR